MHGYRPSICDFRAAPLRQPPPLRRVDREPPNTTTISTTTTATSSTTTPSSSIHDRSNGARASSARSSSGSDKTPSLRSDADAYSCTDHRIYRWTTLDEEHLESLRRIRRIERGERMQAIRAKLESLRQPVWTTVRFYHATPNYTPPGLSGESGSGIDWEGMTTEKVLDIPRNLACSLRRTELERLERILSDELERLEEEQELDAVYGDAERPASDRSSAGSDTWSTENSGYARFNTSETEGMGSKVQIRRVAPTLDAQVLSVIDPMDSEPAGSIFSRKTSPSSPSPPFRPGSQATPTAKRRFLESFFSCDPAAPSTPARAEATRRSNQEATNGQSEPAGWLPSAAFSRPSLWRWNSDPVPAVPRSVIPASASTSTSVALGSAHSSHDSDYSYSAVSEPTKAARPICPPTSSMGGQRLQRSYQVVRTL
ncbi:hypothetical protein ACQY0O_007314 [Thecaphora frezii]